MFLKYNLPSILWGILILFLLGIPGNNFETFSFLSKFHLDKIIHIFLFFIFVILLIIGFKKQNSFNILRNHSILIAILISILYGATIEISQAYIFIKRTGDTYDIIANTFGTLLGIGMFYGIIERR
jgi:VanZ family protein